MSNVENKALIFIVSNGVRQGWYNHARTPIIEVTEEDGRLTHYYSTGEKLPFDYGTPHPEDLRILNKLSADFKEVTGETIVFGSGLKERKPGLAYTFDYGVTVFSRSGEDLNGYKYLVDQAREEILKRIKGG